MDKYNALVIILGVFVLILLLWVMHLKTKVNKIEEKSPCENPQAPDASSYDTEAQRNLEFSTILMKFENDIATLLFHNEIDTAIRVSEALIYEMPESGFAVERHFSFLRQLDMFYPLKSETPDVFVHCMLLCKKDMEFADELLKELKPPVNLVSPTKMAIMLEQQGLIDEAISVCDWAIEKDIWDYRKNSFRDRKNRLIKKLEKNAP
jgi:hypothetical protein